MEGNEIKIKFLNDKAFLVPEKSLMLGQLEGLPVGRTFELPAFWVVKILSYKPDEKKIFVKILEYNLGECDFSQSQLSLSVDLSLIEKVTFNGIDTGGLFNTINGRSSKSVRSSQSKSYDRYKFKTEQNYSLPVKNEHEKIYKEETFNVPIKTEPEKIYIVETFYIPIKKLQFKLGEVTFEKKFKEYSRTIELSISNHNIREEFDAVKNYFSNVLKTKKVGVSVKIEIIDNEIISKEINSPEIQKIDEQLIGDLKFEFLKSTKKRKITNDFSKNALTMEEYFKSFADNEYNPNTFHENEKELFKDLLHITKTKHYNHLSYLSRKHSHNTMKLRFIQKPFSFLFLIKGVENSHIIWETLDTQEATYVWHTKNDVNILKTTLKEVDDIINKFIAHGKTDYIKSSNDHFDRIYHDYSESGNGFKKWKSGLEEILT